MSDMQLKIKEIIVNYNVINGIYDGSIVPQESGFADSLAAASQAAVGRERQFQPAPTLQVSDRPESLRPADVSPCKDRSCACFQRGMEARQLRATVDLCAESSDHRDIIHHAGSLDLTPSLVDRPQVAILGVDFHDANCVYVPAINDDLWRIENLRLRADAMWANKVTAVCTETKSLVATVADASVVGSLLQDLGPFNLGETTSQKPKRKKRGAERENWPSLYEAFGIDLDPKIAK